MTSKPDPEKIEQLRQALAEHAASTSGTGLFDAEAEEAKASVRKRALGLLDQRARSRAELRGRLIDAEFNPGTVDEVIDDLTRAGLIDDAAFAREWVRQRHARRGKSASALDRELRDKGVDGSIRAEALDQIDAEDEEATARKFAEKKARSLREAPADYQEYQKALRRVVGVLARRGFPNAMSMQIAREVLDARIENLSETDSG
ncbi:recombination regulator RecX [Corynebacterium guangdongense]|uniref:Regulatory protein RecX n=1 Tax=Corynebacterium guangdongense TaxID=1783348 RepID=A0ABU1ZX65_9CORY|nr:recombination regulator RecX [Corynebacterium guangdongense]MDR7329529.1 regulatory protein [Corynebacterium guangdongense]